MVGTGIAGLSFAIKTALRRKDLSITIMTKALAEASNTQFAQGGIAAVLDTIEDSFEKHIEDTLKAGGGSCDREIVQMVVQQAPERLYELIGLGVHFDKDAQGYDLALEGGHSHRRILHHGDTTGMEIEGVLLAAALSMDNISILEKHSVIDLVTEKGNCTGAFYITPDNGVKYIRFKAVILSTGGCGQLFKHTTNPNIATADGVAMASHAGAAIADMQYIQFHPTALYEPGKNPSFLLSEALRGFGAHIVNGQGLRFLFQSDSRGELATRDIVSRAIGRELLKSGKEFVFLDCRHLDPQAFKMHFPAILAYCRSINRDPFTELLPILPVAHYQCGGIVVNKYGQSTIPRLYAIGECACTGLHGKNRLASNSLLEAVVFAHQASQDLCSSIDAMAFSSRVYINKYQAAPVKKNLRQIRLLKQQLQEAMQSLVLGERSALSQAAQSIALIKNQAVSLYDSLDIKPELIELLNMCTVAALIVKETKNEFLITTKIEK